jgi:tetratricopeptide (TPR) repeat protein
MSDSTKPRLDDRIDRYVRNELTAAEARELAQQSLDDPKLFEDLTSSALTNAALSTKSVREQLRRTDSDRKVIRFPRRTRILVTGVAAAAALLLIAFYSLKSSSPRQNLPSLARNQPREAVAPALRPTLAFSAKAGQPLLLARDLQPALARPEGTPIFRSPEPDSRSPQSTGSIVAIEDGLAALNLGSLDGLVKGSELQVFRDEHSTELLGRLIVTTVFRDRARGRIAGPRIQVHNQVRVPAAAYLGSLFQQVEALSGRANPSAARTAAEKAVAWAETANVPPGLKRIAFSKLAALEYQTGTPAAAEKHYQSAVDSLNAAPQASVQEQSEAFNNLAVLHLLRGDYAGAEATLTQAVSSSPKTNITYSRSLNNLGVLAELRGDRRKAETFYADALGAFARISDSSSQERHAVETNLERLRSSR